MWNYKKGNDASDGQKVKAALEGLKGIVPEIVDIKVHINELSYSTKDIMLDVSFADEAGFLAYKDNLDHKAAGEIVKQYTTDRVAFDYNI